MTPWWFASYRYVFDLVRDPIVRDLIDEWKPIWQQGLAGILFALATIGVIAAVARGWRRARIEDLMTIGVFTVLAVISGRNLIWWTVAIPPALAPCLGVRVRHDSSWSRTSVRLIAIASCVVVLGGVLRVVSSPPDQLLADAPQGITRQWIVRSDQVNVCSVDGGGAGSSTRSHALGNSSTLERRSSHPTCGPTTSRSRTPAPGGGSCWIAGMCGSWSRRAPTKRR